MKVEEVLDLEMFCDSIEVSDGEVMTLGIYFDSWELATLVGEQLSKEYIVRDDDFNYDEVPLIEILNEDNIECEEFQDIIREYLIEIIT